MRWEHYEEMPEELKKAVTYRDVANAAYNIAMLELSNRLAKDQAAVDAAVEANKSIQDLKALAETPEAKAWASGTPMPTAEHKLQQIVKERLDHHSERLDTHAKSMLQLIATVESLAKELMEVKEQVAVAPDPATQREAAAVEALKPGQLPPWAAIESALAVAARSFDYGNTSPWLTDAVQHKQWIIDQMVRRLLGPDYSAWVASVGKWSVGKPIEGETP